MLKGLIMKRLATAFAIATVLAFGMQAAGAQTLKAVKDRGQLLCGANGSLAGFGMPDPQGNWTGFDVDFCRAIAAAIFNDPTKVKFVPLTAANRLTALQSGEVDVLARNTTWTMSRDTSLGIDFAAVNYYDGQGFMVRKVLKVSSALELNDASVCVQQGTTTELNLADYFRSNHMSLKTVTFATVDEALKAYDSGRCDAYTTDSSGLYGSRVLLADPGATSCCRRSFPRSRSRRRCAKATTPGRRGALDPPCDARRRGAWRQQNNVDDQKNRPIRKSTACSASKASSAKARADQRLGLSHHQAGRQLRRSF